MELQRESIFFSSLRALLKSFSTVIGITCGLFVIGIAFFLLSTPDLVPYKSKLTISPNVEGQRTLYPPSAPVVLKIDIHGIIGTENLTQKKIENILLDSRTDFLKGDRVKAVLLDINTPGGTATDADGIYELLMAYKKKYNIPVYAFVNGMCASGGMYIAAAADKVYSTPVSTIGSIGVRFGPAFNFSDVMDKVGIKSLTLTQGKDKDMLNPFRPWKDGEDQSLRNVMEALYVRFVDIVVQGRPHLNKEQLIEEYGAQVYIGPKAAELGYVDNGNSQYNEALYALTEAAGINNERYQVVQLEIAPSFFKQFAQEKFSLWNGKVHHSLSLGGELDNELNGKFLFLYSPTTTKN